MSIGLDLEKTVQPICTLARASSLSQVDACPRVAHPELVAFSCKRRGFYPSCGARRMAESAALLAKHAPMSWMQRLKRVFAIDIELVTITMRRPATHCNVLVHEAPSNDIGC